MLMAYIDGNQPGTVVDGVLNGTPESDVILGADGNLTIYGFGGNDKIFSGLGVIESAQRIYGGDGNDEIVAKGDLWGATLSGDAGDDVLRGDAFSLKLDGGTGADLMIGKGTLILAYFDNIGDQLFIQEVYDSVTVRSSISIDIAKVIFGTGSAMVRLVLTGNTDASLTGNEFQNILTGNDGNNLLVGLGGNDTLDGGAGADKMVGGAGNDTYVLDNAGDVVTEAAGGGTDLVQLSTSWTMAANVEKVALTGSANINATGNILNNTMAGNNGNNALNGGAGNDIISAGDGNDRLFGGRGNDTLTGGNGSDIFVFNTVPNSSTNKDTIVDFNAADDTVWLDNAIFTGVGANGGLSSAAFRIGTAAGDASDRIIYNSSTGALIYDSNGSASGGTVEFAKLTAGLALTNADFFII
jgi:serralysin